MRGYPVMSQDGTAAGYVKLSSLATSTALSAIPADTVYAVIQCEGSDVRWRADGVAPTATDGMLLPAGAERTFDTGSLSTLRFIQTGGAAVLHIHYYK